MNTDSLRYEVKLERTIPKILRRLPADLRVRLAQAIDDLAAEPYPAGCKKLKGYDKYYRIRVGQWRIIYLVDDDRLIVLVIEVAPRGEAYRNL